MIRMRLGITTGVLAIIMSGASWWLLGRAEPGSGVVSPDGSYRVVISSPSRLQRLLHHDMIEPGVPRIYSARDGKLLRTGPVVDYVAGDGGAIWLNAQTGEIAVGRDATFYHLPPLDAQGRPLPIKHELSPPSG